MVDIEKMKNKIEIELEKFENKSFKVLFYVYDTKGAPSGSLANIYETAFALKNMGYNVQMIYSDKEFNGVGSWMGDKYANLPHYNTEKGNVDISPADILFIPEMCANVMVKTKDFPCRRVALLNNMRYLTDIIPHGYTWEQMNIRECIVITEAMKERVLKYFPRTRMHVVNPVINEIFNTNDIEKKPIISVVTNDNSNVNEFVKPFMWMWPCLSWVPIRPLKGLKREDFAKGCKDSAITVWIDKDASFGYSPLEAMACGSIVAGVIPDKIPEWMGNENKLESNGIWCNNIEELQDVVAEMLVSYLHNNTNDNLIKNMKNTVKMYNTDKFNKEIEKIYINGIFDDRRKELQIALSALNNKKEEEIENEK